MMTIKPNPDSGPAARRAAAYVAVVLGCLAVAPWVDRLGWVGNAYIHTLHEMAAVVLALGVAAISLLRFHSRKSDTFLLIGSAFVGVAVLDAYHAAQAPNLLTTSPPWSWLASRLSWEPEHYLLSFHGLPQEYAQRGDPYATHCTRTAHCGCSMSTSLRRPEVRRSD